MAECEWGEENELDVLNEEVKGIKINLDIFELGDLGKDGASLLDGKYRRGTFEGIRWRGVLGP